jgi:predicted metal-dependent phosphotriesterase family hydrolase
VSPHAAPYVQTVVGPVAPESLGFTLTHEHVFLAMWADDGQGFIAQLDDEDVLAAELAMYRGAAGTCLVDQTPGGSGRNPAGLRRLSERTGVAIVAGCGWYAEPFYPARDDLARRTVDDIAAQLLDEIGDGLDGTGVRPGIIGEIGAGQGWVSPLEERVHRAAARAQIATGLPLATHTLHHGAGRHQMSIFDEAGVDPARVCIGHCDTFPSLAYCLTVARWGGYVSLDNIGLQLGDHEESVLRLVLDLVDQGFAEQILLSQDVGQMAELRSRGGRGYTYLAERFLPALGDAGLDEATIRTLTVDNPRRWLTIDGRADPTVA